MEKLQNDCLRLFWRKFVIFYLYGGRGGGGRRGNIVNHNIDINYRRTNNKISTLTKYRHLWFLVNDPAIREWKLEILLPPNMEARRRKKKGQCTYVLKSSRASANFRPSTIHTRVRRRVGNFHRVYVFYCRPEDNFSKIKNFLFPQPLALFW